jgi:hypothetical protein
MKRHFLILSLLALTLFSCGGSQKQNQNLTTENTKNTENADTAKTVAQTVAKPAEIASEDVDGINIAMQVWNVLLESYDPFGMVDEGKEPPAEVIIENLKRITEKSPTIAVFNTEAVAEGFSETLSCYKHNNGTWLVLDYWQSLDSPDKNLKFFEFKDDKLTLLDKYYPDDFFSGGRYLGTIEADKFSVVCGEDECEVIWYKWDGERFTKVK